MSFNLMSFTVCLVYNFKDQIFFYLFIAIIKNKKNKRNMVKVRLKPSL